MKNVVLCGGAGTRLWPLSRTLMPKQFIKLFDDTSLFQLTITRNSAVCDNTLLVTNKELFFIADEQIKQQSTSKYTYLLEGVGRNTAPAITLAALSSDPDEVLFITPSDHLIRDVNAYHETIIKAEQYAKEGHLVTLGITPTYAETGYGYIQHDKHEVLGFFEKPELTLAEQYIAQGNYLWNSGMFCFRAGVFLQALETHAPEILQACKDALAHSTDKIHISAEAMNSIPEDSIDYAVMERATNVKVVPLDAGWNDVGSFESLAQELPNDEHHNLIISDKVVRTIDIEHSIIIDSGDALLVAPKSSTQKVKQVVQTLKHTQPEMVTTGLTGYRPWGSYTILDENEGYKVKRIEVLPHKRISLQSHKYRNEHWVVIKGTATITLNNDTFDLGENESTYIKAGDLHRLANTTNEVLIIIESQVGSYTGEDDIVRYDDDFNRN